MKKVMIFIVILAIIAGGGYWAWQNGYLKQWGINPPGEQPTPTDKQTPTTKPSKVETAKLEPDGSPSTKPAVVQTPPTPTPSITPKLTPIPAGPSMADKVRQAELALAAAKAGLEKAKADAVTKIALTPEYQAAMKTEANVKAVRLRSEPGSQDLIAASKSWMDAKNALARLARQSLDVDGAIAAANQTIKDRTAALTQLKSQLAGEEQQALAAIAAAKAAYTSPAPSIAPAGAGAATASPSPTPSAAITSRNGNSGRTGEGFAWQNLGLRGGIFTDDLTGKITNSTGRDFTVVLFNVTLLDSAGRTLETVSTSVENFKNGDNRPLEGTLSTDPSKVAGFKVTVKSAL